MTHRDPHREALIQQLRAAADLIGESDEDFIAKATIAAVRETYRLNPATAKGAPSTLDYPERVPALDRAFVHVEHICSVTGDDAAAYMDRAILLRIAETTSTTSDAIH